MTQAPLTVGLACYNDYNGVYFTVQALRMYHRDVAEMHLLVVDNCPDSVEGQETAKFCADAGVTYLPYAERTSTFVKRKIFENAPTEYVVCIDCHVLLEPGSLRRLAEYYAEHPHSKDLHQGPIYHDDLKTIHTNMSPMWHQGHFGVWAIDPIGLNPDSPIFEILANGMGLFSCRRSVIPPFNENLRGFGGEEFYIQDKIRQAGGRCLCHPYLRWLHRFGRPGGVPYPLSHDDIMRNYLIEWKEVGRDTTEVVKHYAEYIGKETVGRMVADLAIEGVL